MGSYRHLYFILVIILLVSSFTYVYADTPWLNGWSYRRSISVSNTASALDVYPVSFTMNTQSLISAGKMRSDCGDIRLTTSSGTTTVPYYVQSCNSVSTTIWARVPSVPVGTTTVYVYYGKSDATSESNSEAQYAFYDDFSGSSVSTTKWTENYRIAISSGLADFTNSGYLRTNKFKGVNGYKWAWRQKIPASNDRIGFEFVSGGYHHDSRSDYPSEQGISGPPGWLILHQSYPNDGDWHALEIQRTSSGSMTIHIDGVNRGSSTYNGVTASTGMQFGYGICCSDSQPHGYLDYIRVEGVASLAITVNSEESLDSIPPTASVTGAPSSWQNTNAVAAILCNDGTGSGCDTSSYKYRTYASSPGSCSTDQSTYTSSSTVTSHVWVCGAAKDNANNWGYSSPVEFRVDTVPPTGSIRIENDNTYTRTEGVTLSLTFADTGGSGVFQCRYRDDAMSWTPEGSCSGTRSWILSSGDGTKTVQYEIRDAAGNTQVYSDTIILDTVADTATIAIDNGNTYASTVAVNLNLIYSDTNGMDMCRYRNENLAWVEWESCRSTKPWTLTTGDGTKTVYYEVRDNAGNTKQASDTIVLDTSLPVTTINHSDAGDHWHNTTQAIVLSCTDGPYVCPSTTYRTKVGSGSWSAWASGTSFTLSSTGIHTIEYNSSDSAGNKEPIKSAMVYIDLVKPLATTDHYHATATHWHGAEQTVSLFCSDIHSGPLVGSMRYCLKTPSTSSCSFIPYSSPLTLNEDGTSTIDFYCNDRAGNRALQNQTVIQVDASSPSLVYTTTPTAPDGANGWFVTYPTVRLECSDSNSGCTINYCTTNGSSCVQSTGHISPVIFTLDKQGNNIINYSATNLAGIRSTTYTEVAKVDTIDPIITVVVTPSTPNGKNGWYNTSVQASMNCADSMSGCWIHEWCQNNVCDNTTVIPSTNPLARILSTTNTYNLKLTVYDMAGNTRTHTPAAIKVDVDPPTIDDRYFHNGTSATLVSGPHGNITDRYWRLYLRAAMADQALGSGLAANGRVNIFHDNNTFFKQLTLDQLNGNVNYSSFIVQGNVSYGLYKANFFVEDNAGWKTEVSALNNKLNITKIEINGSETAATIAGNVMTMEPGDITLETGNEKTFFVTLNNYLNSYNSVRLTVTTTPTGAPASNWAWFTKYKYSPQNRTILDIDLGIGDTVTVPVSVIGGISGFDYVMKVTANFTQEAVVYEKTALIQVRDPNRGFFTTSPEPTTLFSLVASFVAIFLVFSSHKLSDSFK